MTNEKIKIGKMNNYIGKSVDFAGWVKNVRDLKKIQFLVLGDETGYAQAVNFKQGTPLDNYISNLTPNSTIYGSGKVVENPHVKMGGLELQLEELETTSVPIEPSPIDESSSLDNRLKYRWVELRRPEKQLNFDIQNTVETAMREYWAKEGFREIHSPKLMSAASESGAELFSLDHFGEKAYLAQSPQFYKQMAMAAGMGNVFEIGPVFRANNSHTSRHDSEFTSVDSELSWIDSHHDVMDFEEGWLKHVIKNVYFNHGKDIKKIFNKDLIVPTGKFPRMTMDEVQKTVRSMGYSGPEDDLNREGEKLLSDFVKSKHGSEFVFITDYPTSARPFYHMRHEDKPNLTKSFDLLWDGLEITTGAQREHRYDILEKQIKENGIDPKELGGYLDFFKHGCPPHGGFGVGLTRLLMNLTDQKNVRETTFVYRGPGRLTP